MPTHADAELILKLYDLRREAEMRKARRFIIEQFWPQGADDVLKIIQGFGTQENAWFRQVIGYWEMVASFVNNNILDVDLLLDSTGELWFVYTKFKPFVPELRKALHPEFLTNTEKAATSTQRGRDRVAYMEKMFAARAERTTAQGAQAQSAQSSS
jgi:hypothetical protein